MSDEIETVELADDAADAIAERVYQKIQRGRPDGSLAVPNRTVLGDVPANGIVAKGGESAPVFYGGDDMYTDAGATDAETASSLYLCKSVLSAKPGYQPSARMREVMVKAAEAAMRQAPAEIPRTVVSGGYTKAVDLDGFIGRTYRQYRAEAYKAMTSTGANAGDEWVPTFSSSDLWKDVHLETTVSASIPRIAMPTNPFQLPTLDSDVSFKLASTENTAVTAADPKTGRATLTAVKVQAEVDFSGEVTEDSIVPLAPSIRANFVRRGAQCIDDLIVHGDTETGATGNVNTDNGAPAADAFYLAFNGLRKFALVTNTGQVSAVTAALTTANFTTIRGLLGKYGARPNDLRIITGQSTLNTMYDISQVKTLDVYGPNATIVQGELARFFGIPILPSEATPVTDSDKVEADGKSNSTAGTKGWLTLVNINGWRQGFRRELVIESWRDIKKDQNVLVCSFRMALIPSGIAVTHTAVGRDITV